MKLLFRILFRKTARHLVAEAMGTGIGKGFLLGRQYEQANSQGKVVILNTRASQDIDNILEKAGW